MKGTAIREEAPRWDYVYKDYPPYEVLANRWLSYDEISTLKVIDDLLHRYYNSHVFDYTLAYCIPRLFVGNAFRFYEALARFYMAEDLAGRPLRRERLYVILADFLSRVDPENSEQYKQLLILDFVVNNRHLNIPHELGRTTVENQEPESRPYRKNKKELAPGSRNKDRGFPLDILFLAGIKPAPRSRVTRFFSVTAGKTTLEYIDSEEFYEEAPDYHNWPQNPDLDSIASAIAYARLKQLEGESNVIAGMTGELNNETVHVLKKLGIKPPERIKDVRARVEDLLADEETEDVLSPDMRLQEAGNLLRNRQSKTLAVVDAERRLLGLVTIGDLAMILMDGLADRSPEGAGQCRLYLIRARRDNEDRQPGYL